MPGFLQQLGDVQEGLGRDAPAIETDPSGIGLRVDEGHPHAEVRRVEGGRIPARACADDHDVSIG